MKYLMVMDERGQLFEFSTGIVARDEQIWIQFKNLIWRIFTLTVQRSLTCFMAQVKKSKNLGY